MLGLAALTAVKLVSFTWEMLSAMAALYIIRIPIGIRSYRRQKRDYENRLAEERHDEDLAAPR